MCVQWRQQNQQQRTSYDKPNSISKKLFFQNMESFWIFTTKYFPFVAIFAVPIRSACHVLRDHLIASKSVRLNFNFMFCTYTKATVYIYAFRCMHWKFDTFGGHYGCEWWASFVKSENDKNRKQEQIHFRLLLRKTILISSIAVSDSFACIFPKKKTILSTLRKFTDWAL